MPNMAVIMMYTNGFSDNVELEDYVTCLRKNLDTKTGRIMSYSEAANCQVMKANYQSMNEVWKSPWAYEHKNAGIHGVIGGRQDDVTVSVMQLFFAEEGKDKFTYN